MKMGNKNSGERIYKVNTNFFSKWSPEMAYILGFTCADGNVHERTLAWELSNKHKSNLELLQSFNKVMNSNYPIRKRPSSYRLRMSDSIMLKDVKKLGIVPNKKKILIFPKVPNNYLRHFLRGFLDGDGWITTRVRKNGGKEICVGFSNGSFQFTKTLVDNLLNIIGVTKVNLRERKKITKKGKTSVTYQLEFYSHNANKIIKFLYDSLSQEDLYLKRKYSKALKATNYYKDQEQVKKVGRKYSNIQYKFKTDIIKLMKKDLYQNELIPKEIANKLGVSLSTLYRWLDKTKIRTLEKRGSPEWSRRVIESRRLTIKNG